MSSSAHAQACPDYDILKMSWEEASKTTPPSIADYQTFVEALQHYDFERVELQLKQWCSSVPEIVDFQALINFLQSIAKMHQIRDLEMEGGIRLSIFKGIWLAFYSTVAHFQSNPPSSSFEELIAAATCLTDVVEKCLSIVMPGIQSSQTENNLSASIAEIWSHLVSTVRLSGKLVSSLPWRDIQVCLTQKLVNTWTYIQSDEILHAFLTSQLRFHESLPVLPHVLREWSAFQASKEDFEGNFWACIAGMDAAKGVEKNLVTMLNNFKRTLEEFAQQAPAVSNKPKKGPRQDKAYDQLEMMNDIQSLRRVLHYLSLARGFSSDPKDDSSAFLHVLLIERVLQVTGESVKNTAGSANLSAKKRKTLENAKVPLETLSALRNSLSHYNYFSVERKQHVENAIDVKLVLHELAKLEEIFAKVLRRIEFTLVLELARERAKACEKDTAEAQFFVSLGGCQSFAQVKEKIRERMTDAGARSLHFLIQQFDIQSKVCKMEALFSSINAADDKHETGMDVGIWKDSSDEKKVAKSTITEITEMKNIEDLLQDLAVSADETNSSVRSSSRKPRADTCDFLETFIDALAHKYMSKGFYANVAHELFLGADYPVNPEVIETLLFTYGDAEFATDEARGHACSALRILDAVLHFKRMSMDTDSDQSCKNFVDHLSDLIADARFQPVTEKQVEDICESIGFDDCDILFVMRTVLQDMFESVSDETDHGIYNILEKVIGTCCSAECMELVQKTKEDAALKAARLKLISHMKEIASKKKGTLTECEFISCKAAVNDAKAGCVQSSFDCGNGRFRESDLKLLKNMASPFEKLCKSVKETKSLEDGVRAFKVYLSNLDVPALERDAALSCFRSIQQDCLESFVALRIKQLQRLLEKYDIPVASKPNRDVYAKFKCNRNLRAAIEMLLLECLEIVDSLYVPPGSQINLCSNFTLCGPISSADLRNYLAHGNSLLDSCDADICQKILDNAIEIANNGECIMALRNLFEDGVVYGFIKCAAETGKLHTVHISTIAPLAKREIRTTVDKLQSFQNWEGIVKKYFEAEAQSRIIMPCKQINTVTGSQTLPTKLMAEDALNLMLRNHLDQFALLIRTNSAICNHLFRNSWTLLHYAMTLKQNAGRAVDILLDTEVDVNATDDRNQAPLHVAVLSKSEVGIAKLLSRENIKVDAQNADGLTALHIASQQGSEDIVESLLSHNAKPNVQSHRKWSALHYAVSYGHASIVHLLLRAGANPNVVGQDKWTPLHLATCYNQLDIMETLLERSADPYATLADDLIHVSRSVIHLAASYGTPAAIQLLLDRGVDVDLHCPVYRYGYERRPLHFASFYGMKENVKFLLSHPKVDKDSVDYGGCTAIEYAMLQKQSSLVKLMLNHGCKINPNAIISAAYQGDLEMLQLLHERGADLNTSFHSLVILTPSSAAMFAKKLDVLMFLLEAAHPDIDELMRTACSCGFRSVVELLIAEKHYPDAGSSFRESKETPLHIAAKSGNLALVRYLVDTFSLDIDSIDGDGNTPCMLATLGKKWAVVNYCLKHGADATGERGERMARVAAYHSQWTLARELYVKGASLDTHWTGSELNMDMPVFVTAACKGNLGMLDYLIEKQRLNVHDLPLRPLLVLLATHAKQNVLHYLTTKGLDLTPACDDKGATGLHHAALAGNTQACAFFLDDADVPIDQVDKLGCSALHYAVRGRQLKMVKYLLGRKANASVKSLDGQSPLFLALEVAGFDIIDCFVQHEDLLSKEMPDADGNSFLMLVIRRCDGLYPSQTLCAWMDHAGADIFHTNAMGESVLHSVVRLSRLSETLGLVLSKAGAVADDSSFSDFLNAKDRNGNSPVMIVVMTALDADVRKAIEALMKHQPDLNVQNHQQQSVLHLAVQRQNADVLSELLKPLYRFLHDPVTFAVSNVADPRLKDGSGLTPLALAQKFTNKKCIDWMLDYEHQYKLRILHDEEESAKVETAIKAYIASNASTWCLFDKTLMRDVQFARRCLEAYPSCTQFRDANGDSPFHYAAEGGNVEVLMFLISAGSDASAANNNGQTALHIAASHGHVAAVDFLVAAVGLECHTFDAEGHKPVHSAANSGKVDVLKYFFEKGLTDVDDVDEAKDSCLKIAAVAGRTEAVGYLLTRYGPDAEPLENCDILNDAIFYEQLSTVGLLVNKGALGAILKAGLRGLKSPLFLAIKNEFSAIATLMLESATPEQLTFFLGDNGPGLLVCAAVGCRLDVVVLLVEKAGLDPNAPVERGETPLMGACSMGKVDVVRYLLSKNANPNAFHHSTKMTALHEAAMNGHLEVARILLEHNADVLAEDHNYRTPMHTALEFHKWDVAVLILGWAGRSAKELFESLPYLHQEELRRHAESRGLAIECLS